MIVIGASNREDLIDPAILRPGRLDVKIKIERPDAQAAAQIFSRYLTPDLPLDPQMVESLGGGDVGRALKVLIEDTVVEMYRTDETNRFLEVTYQNGDKEIMYLINLRMEKPWTAAMLPNTPKMKITQVR